MTLVTPALRKWFMVHFAVDAFFGIPLLLDPAGVTAAFGIPTGEAVFARLVGAALIAIGLTSVVVHDAGPAVYRVMLDLKIFWSLAAIAALLIELRQGAPWTLWPVLLVFAGFWSVWMRYRLRIAGSHRE